MKVVDISSKDYKNVEVIRALLKIWMTLFSLRLEGRILLRKNKALDTDGFGTIVGA
jgi:hypothetical protein